MTHGRLLFEIWPYVALAIFGAGVAGRLFALARRSPPAPQELASERAWYGAGRFWRAWWVCVSVVVAAHVVGLAAPRAVLAWNAAAWRLYLLEGAGLVFGVATAVGWLRLVVRHLDRPAQSLAVELVDSAFFSLVFVALASGVATAVAYRWASSWAVATLGPYTAGLLHGKPRAVLVDHLPFLVQVHVIAAVSTLALLPFSRVALLPVAVVHRAAGVMSAGGAAATARVRAWWRKRDRLAWLWPEGELRWLDGAPPEGEAARADDAEDDAPPRPRRQAVNGRLYESGS